MTDAAGSDGGDSEASVEDSDGPGMQQGELDSAALFEASNARLLSCLTCDHGIKELSIDNGRGLCHVLFSLCLKCSFPCQQMLIILNLLSREMALKIVMVRGYIKVSFDYSLSLVRSDLCPSFFLCATTCILARALTVQKATVHIYMQSINQSPDKDAYIATHILTVAFLLILKNMC